MPELSTVTSADGTAIAYRKTGSGPAVIVISNVAEDHTGVVGVAEALFKDFTVISFDRRGRGASGDPQPYDPAREIEDIAALIEVAGGSAALTSGSGGCGLTLDAARAGRQGHGTLPVRAAVHRRRLQVPGARRPGPYVPARLTATGLLFQTVRRSGGQPLPCRLPAPPSTPRPVACRRRRPSTARSTTPRSPPARRPASRPRPPPGGRDSRRSSGRRRTPP